MSLPLVALLLTAAIKAQDPTTAVAPRLLFERCPALIQNGTTIQSDTTATSDGFDVFLGASAEERSCDVFIQWRVDDSLAAIRTRLEADGWSSAGASAWTRDGRLVLISRFEEDGVPGAGVIMADMDGPLGIRFTAERARSRRPLIEVARRALFDLCPVLLEGEVDHQREVAATEPELFRGGPAADPAEGQISIDPGPSICAIKLQGDRAGAVVGVLRQDAEGRGYTVDGMGRLWTGDRVILMRQIPVCPPGSTSPGCSPLFNVLMFDRPAYEGMVGNGQPPVGRTPR